MRPRFLLLLLGLPFAALAQTTPGRHATVLDLTGAVGPTLNATSVAGWRLWGLDRAGRFQAGIGVRTTFFYAGENDYDAQNVSRPGVVLRVSDPRIVAFNAAFHLRARVVGPLRVGFNLDAIGVSVGAGRTGRVVADNGSTTGTLGTEPVRGNYLQGGSSDRGSLNSEFYASVALPGRVSLRAGYSHVTTAYGSDAYFGPGNPDAARYRRFRNLALLGLSYDF